MKNLLCTFACLLFLGACSSGFGTEDEYYQPDAPPHAVKKSASPAGGSSSESDGGESSVAGSASAEGGSPSIDVGGASTTGGSAAEPEAIL